MKRPIAGVAPLDGEEVTVMTVWPSVTAMSLGPFPVGRILGRWFANRTGVYIFTLGNLCCLLAIPIALVLFFKRIGPFVGVRYRLTNRRIVVEHGLSAEESRAVDLDRFDAIDIEVPSGYAWYYAGDLIFRLGNVETFRLIGVSRPETFRHTCLKTRQAYVGVRRALQRERVPV